MNRSLNLTLLKCPRMLWMTFIRLETGSWKNHLLILDYIPDKLVSREISYQTVGYRITKVLRESNKAWPIFLDIFGIFALENYRHANMIIFMWLRILLLLRISDSMSMSQINYMTFLNSPPLMPQC